MGKWTEYFKITEELTELILDNCVRLEVGMIIDYWRG